MTDSTTSPRPRQLPERGAATPLHRLTRALLAAFTVLTLLGVTALLGGATRTDRAFAWTIEPPLTAAFLGVGYASGTVLVLLAARSGSWVVTSVPVLTIGVFTALTLLASLLHLDRFHLTADPVPRAAAWLWLGVYVLVPVVIAVVLIRQGRVPPNPAARPLPGVLRVALLLEGGVLGLVGAGLYLAPATAERLWPWPLTPLTARVVAAWLLAYALAAAVLTRLDDLDRLAAPAVAYAVLGAGELAVALVGGADLTTAAGAGYALTAVAILLTGVAAARGGGLTPVPR